VLPFWYVIFHPINPGLQFSFPTLRPECTQVYAESVLNAAWSASSIEIRASMPRRTVARAALLGAEQSEIVYIRYLIRFNPFYKTWWLILIGEPRMHPAGPTAHNKTSCPSFFVTGALRQCTTRLIFVCSCLAIGGRSWSRFSKCSSSYLRGDLLCARGRVGRCSVEGELGECFWSTCNLLRV
jgi:hypothetical protein